MFFCSSKNLDCIWALFKDLFTYFHDRCSRTKLGSFINCSRLKFEATCVWVLGEVFVRFCALVLEIYLTSWVTFSRSSSSFMIDPSCSRSEIIFLAIIKGIDSDKESTPLYVNVEMLN